MGAAVYGHCIEIIGHLSTCTIYPGGRLGAAAGNGERDGHRRARRALSIVGRVRSGRDGVAATAQLAAAAENVGASVFAQGVRVN
jgi:hypothetical protein